MSTLIEKVNLFAESPTYDYKTGKFTGNAQCGVIFTELLNSDADIDILQGGTDSGKTYGVIQFFCYIAINEPPPKVDPIITVLGATIPNLKKGAYRHFKNIVNNSPSLPSYIKRWNETDRTVEFTTGWIVEFVSAIDEQDAKQGKRQYLLANEANGIDWLIFWQMAKRTRIKTIIDYNPTAEFWAHQKLIGTDKYSNDLSASVKLIITDHRHNPFLSYQDHFRTENIQDDDLWKVYARGMTGALKDVLFRNINYIDEFPSDIGYIYTNDFGFTTDPNATVKYSETSTDIFAELLIYEPIETAELLDAAFVSIGVEREVALICDSSDKYVSESKGTIKMVRDLMMLGYEAHKVSKTKSVMYWLLSMKGKRINVVKNHLYKHVREEAQNYRLMEINGVKVNQPIDKFNHFWDAVRYGHMAWNQSYTVESERN
ncbi:hypothetical protein LIV57_06715 [Chryseobacterium sp. X308]|uniref:hypothetical protein n=1 Tax=Chryseobacterium sp. X308 TaxID=2884873 RepID=UPI001D1534C6|nr:hypothetical protein [Chryseobacterium sp. X308]MCC3214959.1 hypothetical protein [Chryseobacterium sp. X308]